ncbi:MAG: amino acid--tRNA ligase-related protein [Candidatus Campbellbacteria bacterium]|nr:amino acid--tRNA ligase-related protein [Candidatus Campbellbacteria bacterium]
MERKYIEDLKDYVGEEVFINGFVWVKRDQGKIVFFDFKDATGTVQAVAHSGNPEAVEKSKEVKHQWTVEVRGKVKERPEKMRTEDLNGSIELELLDIEVISKAKELPFDVTEDTSDIDENLRLKYRYLDLRSERMQRNIRLRSQFVQKCREYLFGQKFTEIETPILTESTPEGSRDFVVPSRLHLGKFYALPQSPQQYKQLLMTAGFEKYFQIARAIRDEDLRADRGFEHSQIDIELSFVARDQVIELVEEMMTKTVESMGYSIKEKPFPRISYKEALDRFGDDKFDLRTEEEKEKGILSYAWVVDFPFFEKTDNGDWTFSHNPFSQPKEEHVETLLKIAERVDNGENPRDIDEIGEILTTQYDLVCNGFESGGGSIRAHKPEVLRATYKAMGMDDDYIEKSVGHMLEAFEFGTPPHGGIALGIERNIMNLSGEDALREVQAFPMTRGGHTSVMQGPSEISEKQLKELGISIKRKDTEAKSFH